MKNEELWKELYDAFVRKEITIDEAANKSGHCRSTVFNKFEQFGYIRETYKVDRDKVTELIKQGVSIPDISKQFNCTTSYIRYILRHTK